MNRTISAIILVGLLQGGDYYTDRLLIYIDNSVAEFQKSGDTRSGWTNLSELDILLEAQQTTSIEPWLKHARPEDQDGDVYLDRFLIVKFNQNRPDIDALRTTFESNKYITRTEKIAIMRSNYTPSDPRFSQQWFLPIIDAPEAWDLWDIDGGDIPGTTPNRVIKVAVVDDGVDWDHQDLLPNIWNNLGEDADGDGVTIEQSGGNWILDPGDIDSVDNDGDGYEDNLIGWDIAASSSGAEDNDPTPVSGDTHGTEVSGAVSGVTNNGIGIASVGWSINIMPIKASYANNGFIDSGYQGILAAAHAGADVINCSWGGFGHSNSAQNLLNVVHNQYGSIIVASAGNGNEDTGQTNLDAHYPSGYDNVISVTATGSGDHFNCWATAGTTIDLCAPGENIMTTFINNQYFAWDGTSFSAPIVAGAVGLIWSKFPDESQAWIEDRIVNSTDYFDDMDRNCNVRNNDEDQSHSESMTGLLGSGRLNIFKALAGGIFPSLTIQEVNLLGDSDGDGVFNPGETVNLKVVVLNEEGWASATDVVVVLSSEDPRITIVDNVIEFPNTIAPGTSAFTLFDAFQIMAAEDALTGPVVLTVTMSAGEDPYLYEQEEEIVVALSLTQENFPYQTSSSVKTSPIVADLNNDGHHEIYFGSDDFKVYGINEQGENLPGFPFITGNQVRSSVAIGDIDVDGDQELVFGSKDKHLYVLAQGGSPELSYQSDGYIMHTPVLADLDGDNDLEIIFGTFETGAQGQGGKVYAIHHDSSDVAGFPVDIGESIITSPAVGDLEGDGELDIVVGTWSDSSIYAITASGIIKNGFPFITGNRINTAPSLANLTGDEKLEIAVGSDDNKMHFLNYEGIEIDYFDTGYMVRGSPSFYDVSADGYPEVFFAGYDRKVHVYNVTAGSEINGWPITVDQNILSSPVIVDLDNDGIPEVVVAKYGGILAYHLDGTVVSNFPITTSGSIESSPTVQDLDNDGDFEILIGTSSSIEVIDIKTQKGSDQTWNIYRGSFRRTGNYQDVSLSVRGNYETVGIPTAFAVSNNYPNPFNGRTLVKVSIPETGFLNISIYDIRGRTVNQLVNREITPGYYLIDWSGKDQQGLFVASGVYIFQLKFGAYHHSHKMLLVK